MAIEVYTTQRVNRVVKAHDESGKPSQQEEDRKPD